MPRIPFDQLPSDARLWIFAAERPLSPSEKERVLEETDAFINQWMAHGVPLTAGRDLRHEQFVLDEIHCETLFRIKHPATGRSFEISDTRSSEIMPRIEFGSCRVGSHTRTDGNVCRREPATNGSG